MCVKIGRGLMLCTSRSLTVCTVVRRSISAFPLADQRHGRGHQISGAFARGRGSAMRYQEVSAYQYMPTRKRSITSQLTTSSRRIRERDRRITLARGSGWVATRAARSPASAAPLPHPGSARARRSGPGWRQTSCADVDVNYPRRRHGREAKVENSRLSTVTPTLLKQITGAETFPVALIVQRSASWQ